LERQTNLIDKMFEFNLWANSELITFCSQLTDEQLAVEVQGVFGGIHSTFVHLIRAEGNYLNRVTGSRPWEDEPDWENISISELLALAQLSGAQLVATASKADPTVRHDVERRGEQYHFFNWTVLSQAFYHGIEHRTQIKFLLSKLGLEHPELSVWDFTDALSTE
jgi:uncharacterized damage-inducible protein DinB